ncbi:hypothetical protein CIB48_g8528 [Xylaria polymorpha]|nr:hypothetical protein CIB48_g8528 [Xylaria polymorpha]
MAPTNTAAIYPSNQAPALVIGPSPYPTPAANEVIVRVNTAAINPVDHKVQELGTTMFPFLTFPLVGGLDVSGTIVEVGSAASSIFSAGDRVLGFPSEFVSRSGGFQNYVAVPADLVSAIPPGTSFVDAAVLPANVATAAVGLFHSLGLEPPSSSSSGSASAAAKKNQTVLVTAGASSVGSNAIQLAVAAGYEVYTTSSPRNFAHCTALGAARVFDYHSATLSSEIQAALKGKQLAGALSCVEESNALAWEVVAAGEGGQEGRLHAAVLDGGGALRGHRRDDPRQLDQGYAPRGGHLRVVFACGLGGREV